MSRAPLIEEDQAFLQRLQTPKRHCTFAAMIIREIRGHHWNNGAAPQTDVRLILCLVHDQLARYGPESDEAQWCQAITAHWAEAQRYVHWLLAWEQRLKPEKAAYRRQRYQAYKRAMAI